MEDVQIVELPKQLVMSSRQTGAYTLIPKMLGQLAQTAQDQEVELIGMPMFVCHEKSREEALAAKKARNADVEVVVAVDKKGEDSDQIKYYEQDGGTFARYVHKGAYAGMPDAYEKLFAWISENGKTVTGPTREIYMNDPRQVEREDLITELYAPVE